MDNDTSLLDLSDVRSLTCNCEKTKLTNSNTTASSDGSDAICESINSDNSSGCQKTSRCCLKQRLGIFFNFESFSDVHFIVGQDSQKQRIPAHKLVLVAGSEVFSAMFSDNWSVKCNDIEVPDVTPVAFLALLRFLYTDEVSIIADMVVDTLYAAKKYAIIPLEKRCVEFLIEILSPENAFSLFIQARLFDEQLLISECLVVIDTQTDDAFISEGFLDIDLKTLCVVLERDHLSASEVFLFEAVFRWSKAECERKSLTIIPENQRSVAKEAISLIRFPLMSVNEFASVVAPSDLLTSEEVISIFLYFNSDSKPSINFSSTPRWYKELSVNRFQQIQHGWIYSGDSEGIGFTPDMNIKLIGLGLYGSTTGHTGYEVTMKLIDNFSEDVLYENLEVYQCDGKTVTYKALLDEPVQLQAYTNYTLIVTIWGPDSFCGEEGLKEVTLDLPHSRNVTFVFNAIDLEADGQPETLRTSVEHGQIPELLFSV